MKTKLYLLSPLVLTISLLNAIPHASGQSSNEATFRVDTAEVQIPLLVQPKLDLQAEDIAVYVGKTEVPKTVQRIDLPWEIAIVMDTSDSMRRLFFPTNLFKDNLERLVKSSLGAKFKNFSVTLYNSSNNLDLAQERTSPENFVANFNTLHASTNIGTHLVFISQNPVPSQFTGRIVVAISDGVDRGVLEEAKSGSFQFIQPNSFLIFVDASRLPEVKEAAASDERWLKGRYKALRIPRSRLRASYEAELRNVQNQRMAFTDLVSASYGEYLYPSNPQQLMEQIEKSLDGYLSASHQVWVRESAFSADQRQVIRVAQKGNRSIKNIYPLRKSFRRAHFEGVTQSTRQEIDWEPPTIDTDSLPVGLGESYPSTMILNVKSQYFNTYRGNSDFPEIDFSPTVFVETNSWWLANLTDRFGEKKTILELELRGLNQILNDCNIRMNQVSVVVSDQRLLPQGLVRNFNEEQNPVIRLMKALPNIQQPSIYYFEDPSDSNALGVALWPERSVDHSTGWIFISDRATRFYDKDRTDPELIYSSSWGRVSAHEFGHLFGRLPHVIGANAMSDDVHLVNGNFTKSQCKAIREGISRYPKN